MRNTTNVEGRPQSRIPWFLTFEEARDPPAEGRCIEATQAEGGPTVDDVIRGYGPFFGDRVMDLRPEVRRFRGYLFEGVVVHFAVFEELVGLCAVEVEEVIHGRSVETGIKVS